MTLKFDSTSTPSFTPVTGAFTLRISRNLVTIAEWNAFARDCGSDDLIKEGDAQLPVTSVSWDDCQAYITWYNAKHGTNARLPYEWELCLAEQVEGIATRDWSSWPHEDLESAKWHGAHYNDLVGVVFQWCEDPSSDRVRRGGCWVGTASNLRASNRYRYDPSYCHNNLGFRLAFD